MIVRAQRRPGFESDRSYLDVYDTATWTKRTVFETPDLSVSDFALSKDGRTIYSRPSSKGTRQPVQRSACRRRTSGAADGGSIGSIGVGDSTSSSFRDPSLTSPPDLWRDASRRLRAITAQLTRENDGWLKEIAFAQPESLTVAGAGGTPIQYWLIKPPAFDPAKKYPVVFLIHGGPQGAWGDAWSTRWNPSLWAAQGWVVAAPNPRGSTGFGQKFVDEITQDWGGKVMTDLDAVFNTVTQAALRRRVEAGRRRRQLRRLRRQLDHRRTPTASRPRSATTACSTSSRWRSRPRSCGSPNGSSAACRRARRRASSSRSCRRTASRSNMKTPTLVITNELDFRVPGRSGPAAVHGAPPQRRAERDAGLSRRGALGAEGAEQQAVARDRCSAG